MTNKNSEILVGFPLYQGCTLLDFAGATQMFTPYTGAGFKPLWLSPGMKPIETTEGVTVQPGASFQSAPHIDILFIPGGGGDGVTRAMLDESFVEKIDELAGKATWAGSVCTGAFIFAATGRFKGSRATTYWSQLENLALFPEVEVPLDQYPRGIINEDVGTFSGGGVSSSIDLALDLITRIKGQTTFETVELANQYAPEPPFRSGTPAEAPPAITRKMIHDQEAFTQQMREATLQVIAKGSTTVSTS